MPVHSPRPQLAYSSRSNQAPSPFEQRSAPRVATWLPAKLKLAAGPGWIDCHLRDIGTGGACIQTPSPIPLADIRWLQVEFPGETAKICAVGRWQREAGPEEAILTGVEFDSVDADEARKIEGFVHDRLREIVEFLRACPDLAEIGLDEAMDLALVSRLRAGKPGRYLFRFGGTEDDSVFVVFEGSVVMEAEVGGGRIQVARAQRGSLFGGITLLAAVPSYLSAVVGNDVLLLEIDRNAFRYLERAKPMVAAKLASVIIVGHVAQLRTCIDRVVERAR